MGKKQTPLCMNQYKMLFGVCRRPGKTCDTIIHGFPSMSKHILVLIQDQIYKVQVVGGEGQEVLGLDTIKKQLQKCIEKHATLSDDERQPPIGIFTTEKRDVWAGQREHLLKLSDQNKVNLDDIESALFAVCLEDYAAPKEVDVSHRMVFHGKNGRNRWFDVALSFIFDTDARGGCSGEHSPSDAVTPATVFRKVLAAEPSRDADGAMNDMPLDEPEHLKWMVDNKILKAIEKAEIRAESDVADMDSVLLHFNEFGGDAVKSRGIIFFNQM